MTLTASYTRRALRAWDAKTPPSSISPERALELSLPVPWWLRHYFDSRTGETPDHVRTYYDPGMAGEESYQVVLVIRRGLIRDLYRLDEIDHRAARAAFRAFRGWLCGHDPEAPSGGGHAIDEETHRQIVREEVQREVHGPVCPECAEPLPETMRDLDQMIADDKSVDNELDRWVIECALCGHTGHPEVYDPSNQ